MQEDLDLLKDNRSRVVVDEGNAAISRTTELCVECRRCINICPTQEFSFNHRAADVVVGTPYQEPLDCIFCGQCVKHCPTGAITDKNDLATIMADLDNPNKMAIALWDPALLATLSLEQPEIESERKLVGVLRTLGFEAVLDLEFGMELFVDSAAREIKKSGKSNVILSHCPSLNLYLEKYYPQLKENLLGVATPDALLANFVKREYAKINKINASDIVVVSISSCTAKKIKKGADLEHVLTLRELGRIIRQKNLKIAEIEGREFNRVLAPKNKKAREMAACGKAAEMIAAEVGGEFVVANEVKNIKKILDGLTKKRIQTKIIELAICPGGCVGGGGQSNKIL